MITSFLIAIGLNFDTFSVSIVGGAESKKPTLKSALKIGLFFGIGQALMVQIGAILGIGFKVFISNLDHWVAFILLSAIGIKMIYESQTKEKNQKKIDFFDSWSIIPLIIATSIDSLVIGITLAFIKGSILADVIIIGFVTFLASSLGFYSGKKLKLIFRDKVKIIGGLILIIIGAKILLEHLFFIHLIP